MNKIKLLGGLLLSAIFHFQANAQQRPNWQNLDLARDSVFGISTERAYKEFLRGKKAKPVIVAVIDAGVDTLHEDLKSTLWVNPKKKEFDNGTYGWSFIGSAKGNVKFDNLELTRQVRQLQSRFQDADTTKLTSDDLMAYHAYRQEKKELNHKLREARQSLNGYLGFAQVLDSVVSKIGKPAPRLSDFEAFQSSDPAELQIEKVLVETLTQKDDYAAFRKEQIDGAIEHFKTQVDYQLNVAYDPRPLVGDEYFDSNQRKYGSPDVMGPDPTHGTHVAGIIAAIRGNGIGMDGIADQVRIMAIRTVPSGDERDKDVANAIRYAAQHGAKVINMSFGKGLSQDKKAVDDAIKYALKKDVLIVQAAGNSNLNIDSIANFPNRKFLDGKVAAAYIVVGASGMKNDTTLKAPFSNYGKTSVDVFAPGVQIYSCIPGSKYAYFDGTSMASPVVAGLAALIREYYPKLSAGQVKEIILRSVVRRDYLKNYCKTGGVVNAYMALQLAAEY